MKPTITIFTDGSSRGNPGPGGWGAIVAWDDAVKELGGGETRTTNNRMELEAALQALKFVESQIEDVSVGDAEDSKKAGQSRPHPSSFLNASASLTDILIHTDSSYLINGITKWVKGWVNNGWITKTKEPVINDDVWKKLIDVVEHLKEAHKIVWVHIQGHAGIPGNERCDEIATAFADKKQIKLWSGPKKEYSVDIYSITPTKIQETISLEKKERSKKKAYSYVSMVNGKIEKHATWALCEKRVKGTRGAKFKKSISPEDESAIIAEFQK